MSQIVVLLGKPGSGKDTQAEILKRELNYKLIKTGHFVRTLSKKNTKIAQTLEKGNLVDNNLVNEYVANELVKSNFTGRFMTDGYPRDVVQARWFDSFLASYELAISQVILLGISDEEARRRLKGRHRADDEVEIINNRFKIYRDTTQHVIDYYVTQGKLLEVDANRSPEEISIDIKEAIK